MLKKKLFFCFNFATLYLKDGFQTKVRYFKFWCQEYVIRFCTNISETPCIFLSEWKSRTGVKFFCFSTRKRNAQYFSYNPLHASICLGLIYIILPGHVVCPFEDNNSIFTICKPNSPCDFHDLNCQSVDVDVRRVEPLQYTEWHRALTILWTTFSDAGISSESNKVRVMVADTY